MGEKVRNIFNSIVSFFTSKAETGSKVKDGRYDVGSNNYTFSSSTRTTTSLNSVRASQSSQRTSSSIGSHLNPRRFDEDSINYTLYPSTRITSSPTSQRTIPSTNYNRTCSSQSSQRTSSTLDSNLNPRRFDEDSINYTLYPSTRITSSPTSQKTIPSTNYNRTCSSQSSQRTSSTLDSNLNPRRFVPNSNQYRISPSENTRSYLSGNLNQNAFNLDNDDIISSSSSESSEDDKNLNQSFENSSAVTPVVLDLHGYRVNEAVYAAEKFIRSHMAEQKYHTVRILTGRGNHSTDNQPKIKPAVQRLLLDMKIPYKEVSNGGCLIIRPEVRQM